VGSQLLKKVANIVRGLAADAVQQANSGHPGMPIGCADIGALLFGEIMNYDPRSPKWPNRDRFILSAGHGSVLLYSLLHLSGYDLSLDDLKNFRQLDSKTPGHPEYGETAGVDTTTGPLGQGLANAVGMAVAERMLAKRYNTDKFNLIDHYTYTILGDGCMMEGVVAEAVSLAGHLGLGKLVAIYDSNDICIGGNINLTFTEDVAKRFEAADWHVIDNVDGHDIIALKKAIEEAKKVSDKPTLIVAKTHIAYGSPTKQDSNVAHGAPLGEEEIRGLKEKFNLPKRKFYVSDKVKEFFSIRQKEMKTNREQWEELFNQWTRVNPELKAEWDLGHNLELPVDLTEAIEELEIKTPIATRKASGEILQKIADKVTYLVGGSADLAPSTKTYLSKYSEIQADNYEGRNFRFGVREHAMGAIANGISVHGGLRPFVATFFVFSDYMRPAIRMAALMKQPVIYVLTHDSIYLGEDGPTHQPVEHLESLRAIPNLKVLRPADAEETKVAWLEAMKRTDGPTVLVLTRQGLPSIDKGEGLKDFAKGAYVVKRDQDADLFLMASGSEVALAIDVAEILKAKDKRVQIVSVPDRDEFVKQDITYIEDLLGSQDSFRVVLEAGISQGWYRLLNNRYHVVSIESFGASGPAVELADKFGFNAEKIAKDILNKL